MARFAVEKHENKERASIHFDFEVPRIWRLSTKENTPRAKELKSILIDLNGIVEVYASDSRQCISLARGGAFTWDELIPKVLESIAEFFQVDQWEEVEVFA